MTDQEKEKLLARIKSGKHLPPCLRDFHDQKDVFKSVHYIMSKKNPKTAEETDWIKGHCYTIDMFLKFMALHGYELRKSKSRPTYDLQDTIDARVGQKRPSESTWNPDPSEKKARQAIRRRKNAKAEDEGPEGRLAVPFAVLEGGLP